MIKILLALCLATPAVINRLGSDQELQNSTKGTNGRKFIATVYTNFGKFGNAILIPKSVADATNRVDFPDIPVTYNPGFTIEMWAMPTNWFWSNGASDATEHLLWGPADNVSWPLIALIFDGSSLMFDVVNAATENDRLSVTTGLIYTNRYTHIACTVTMVSQYIFTNGALMGARALTYAHTNFVRTLYLGRLGNITTLDWGGAIDQVKIWTRPIYSFPGRERERDGLSDVP